jgi:hypothetical protein
VGRGRSTAAVQDYAVCASLPRSEPASAMTLGISSGEWSVMIRPKGRLRRPAERSYSAQAALCIRAASASSPKLRSVQVGTGCRGILARLRWRAPWPRWKGVGVGGSTVVRFPICLHFRRLMIGLNVPASAECEPDKSNRQQGGAGNDQPMWIFHLSIPSSRSFSLLEYLSKTTSRSAPGSRLRDYDRYF